MPGKSWWFQIIFFSYPYLWGDEQDLPVRQPNPSSFHIHLFPPETAFQSSWPILLRQRPAISPTGETRGAVVVFTSVGGRSFRRRFHMRHCHMRHCHMRHCLLAWNHCYTPGKLTWNLKMGAPGSLEISIKNHHFQVPAVSFRGGICKMEESSPTEAVWIRLSEGSFRLPTPKIAFYILL